MRAGGGEEVILLCPKVPSERSDFLWCESYFCNWLEVQVTGLSGKRVRNTEVSRCLSEFLMSQAADCSYSCFEH